MRQPAATTGKGDARLIARSFDAAVAYQQQGRWAEAERLYQAVLALDAAHPGALHNLGYLRLQQDRLIEAERILRKAVKIAPKTAELHNTLGLVLNGAGRFREARDCFERALRLDPAHAYAHNNLGGALQQLNRHADAIPWHRKAIALRPNYPDAQRNLGNALQTVGKIDEARRAFEAAVAGEPGRASFYLSVSSCKRFSPGDRHLTAMEELTKNEASLAPRERTHLHFALAKAYADTGDFARSSRHMLAANALHRSRLAYDETAMIGLFRRVRATFSPAFLAERSGAGEASPTPVFVVGMMRSGTTLIEQILASHPQIDAVGERPDLRQTIEHAVAPGQFPEATAGLSAGKIRQIGSRYLSAVRAVASGGQRIVDKMPLNFLYAGMIAIALPNARIIHAQRDPADTCLSCFALLFKGDLPFCYDLGELGRYYHAYLGLMQHWREILPPGMMLEMPYEALVDDLEGQARRLVAHCGLDWDPACLAFHRTERAVMTASSVQVRQPIYRSSVGRWRPYAAMLEPLFAALADPPAEPATPGNQGA